MSKALFLSPMVPSFNIAETKAFFQDLLGFSSVMESDGYVVLIKDGLTVHLLAAGEGIGQMEFYLEVDDVDGLWSEMKDHVQGIRHREPFDREYGMREAHIDVPATNCLLFIGQAIR